jgi:CheY-like chemotaxis protein
MNLARAKVVAFPVAKPKRVLFLGGSKAVENFFATSGLSTEVNLDRSSPDDRALERLRQQPYDLVISADATPVWDDIELLHEMQNIQGVGLKMIIVAAATTPIEVIEAMRAHAFSVFSTPFDPAALADMIELAINVPLWRDGIEVVSAKPNWVALRVRCSRIAAERLVQFGRQLQIDLPEDERDAIMLSFREILLNAMEHGARFDPNLKVHVGHLRTGRLTLYYLRDPGEGFELAETDHAAVNNPPGDDLRHMAIRVEKGLRAGGYGIKLAQELMDDIVFNEIGNEVVILKYR